MLKKHYEKEYLSRLRGVGRRIGETRHRLGITQARFAEMVERSISVVQEWERGRNFTLKTLFFIAAALDCQVETLFKQPRQSKSRRGRPIRKNP